MILGCFLAAPLPKKHPTQPISRYPVQTITYGVNPIRTIRVLIANYPINQQAAIRPPQVVFFSTQSVDFPGSSGPKPTQYGLFDILRRI
jgi:hypothetical protein